MGDFMEIEKLTDAEFIGKATELLNGLPSCIGETARLGHWLSMALNRLSRASNEKEELRAALAEPKRK